GRARARRRADRFLWTPSAGSLGAVCGTTSSGRRRPGTGPRATDRYAPAVSFDTQLTVTGPWRAPAQMLADQEVDGHASVHDEATASSLGLLGAPIEGCTHFSQFDPLGFELWGQAWFERGCISSHFRTMVIEGE